MKNIEDVGQMLLTGGGSRGFTSVELLRLYTKCTSASGSIENAPIGISVFTSAGRYVIRANSDRVEFNRSGRLNE